MAIEFLCSGCSNTLRVPDEHAGKHARCPQCSSVNAIPNQSQSPTGAAPDVNFFESQPAKPFPSGNPYSEPVRSSDAHTQPYGQQPANPYNAPTASGYQQAHYAPHRGGLILTLGILAFFCNFLLIPGIVAWSLGSSDLKEIKAGRMDPSGHGITMAGMILGIIMTCFYGLFVLFYLGIFALGIFAAAAGNM